MRLRYYSTKTDYIYTFYMQYLQIHNNIIIMHNKIYEDFSSVLDCMEYFGINVVKFYNFENTTLNCKDKSLLVTVIFMRR